MGAKVRAKSPRKGPRRRPARGAGFGSRYVSMSQGHGATPSPHPRIRMTTAGPGPARQTTLWHSQGLTWGVHVARARSCQRRPARPDVPKARARTRAPSRRRRRPAPRSRRSTSTSPGSTRSWRPSSARWTTAGSMPGRSRASSRSPPSCGCSSGTASRCGSGKISWCPRIATSASSTRSPASSSRRSRPSRRHCLSVLAEAGLMVDDRTLRLMTTQAEAQAEALRTRIADAIQASDA